MWRIRRLEREIERQYSSDKIKSPVHLSVGQEAASVGVCAALRPSDVVFATYRGHAAYLAKGGDMQSMVAELCGKATGCGAGRSGSMHLIDVPAGVMGTSAVVGTTIPQAVGYAFAAQYTKSDQVTVSFFGDGATEEGVYHESMNFAALKKLPVLFVCENNLYAIHSHIRDRTANTDFCGRARSYGMSAERIDGGDIFALMAATEAALTKIRAGNGPHFIEVETYRFSRHVGPGDDASIGYRHDSEIALWRQRDQVVRLGNMLMPELRAAIENEVEKEVADAFAFAEASEYPPDSQLLDLVFHD
jgi:TPP-dependent pyruvate/acetoin dehydrogenase alpha subunit